ncbi:hypothetical protein SAMN02745163_00479 [Clostridium cavendishii DSM 21758]|uniref:Lipoprotein n=1 Tax=Clostridium cavendishii DSM 21758 TaxID=1121302 RepID=A0A1M6CJG6_9CLOT|nr:hypothetical protein [Clostridium cavendishii]SHI61011.1 hypothetical protein SAMN02745163_00479 [Clostridium cavendishii DSM 21758]
MKNIKLSIIFLIILSLLFVSCSPNKNKTNAINTPSTNVTSKQEDKSSKKGTISKGTTLINNTQEASKKFDGNQLKIYNGEQVKLNNYRLLDWFDDDNILLITYNSDDLYLYNTKTKKTSDLQLNIPGKISEGSYSNGKLLTASFNCEKDSLKPKASYYEFDLYTKKSRLIFENNMYGNIQYIDDNQKYILIQYYDLKAGNGNGFENTNFVSHIIDRDTGKSISIDEETLYKDIDRYPYEKIGMAIVYSHINNKFYGALKNKIYTFTFDDPAPKIIKDTGNLDIVSSNFHLLNKDSGLLFETIKNNSEETEAYIYNFSSNELTEFLDYSVKSSTLMKLDAYAYNKTKNKLFTQFIDNKTSVLHPIIGEVSRNKLIIKSKISTTEEIKNNDNNNFSALWNKSGTKLLLTCYYVKENKYSIEDNRIQRIINIE